MKQKNLIQRLGLAATGTGLALLATGCNPRPSDYVSQAIFERDNMPNAYDRVDEEGKLVDVNIDPEKVTADVSLIRYLEQRGEFEDRSIEDPELKQAFADNYAKSLIEERNVREYRTSAGRVLAIEKEGKYMTLAHVQTGVAITGLSVAVNTQIYNMGKSSSGGGTSGGKRGPAGPGSTDGTPVVRP